MSKVERYGYYKKYAICNGKLVNKAARIEAFRSFLCRIMGGIIQFENGPNKNRELSYCRTTYKERKIFKSKKLT